MPFMFPFMFIVFPESKISIHSIPHLGPQEIENLGLHLANKAAGIQD